MPTRLIPNSQGAIKHWLMAIGIPCLCFCLIGFATEASAEDVITPQQAVAAALGNTAQFRISNMGPDGDIDYDAQQAAVAYNSVNNEYLVVWSGDDNIDVVDGEFEIFGQRINAATGLEIGINDFRISDVGQPMNPDYDASHPKVAYNSTNNLYLVVWEADDSLGIVRNGESEIYGQLIDGSTGTETGANDFRISDMGVDGDAEYDAITPAVAYNSANNLFLVVWSGEDGTFSGEFEIYGQLLIGSTGSATGSNDFLISTMGPAADTAYDAYSPDVVYNSSQNEFLVVWQGDDLSGALAEGEYEIFGQRINAATGGQVGTDDFRLSDMGPDGNDLYDAADPAVAYNSGDNNYLVVWHGDDDAATALDEIEIFGQLIDGVTGGAVGINDFRISQMGPEEDADYDAHEAAVAYDPVNNEYLVVWHGDTDAEPLVNGENEIFGQRLDAATGAEIGENDFRLSDMGPDGEPSYDATLTGIAFGVSIGEFLVVWEADDTTGSLADGELEIYGQRVEGGSGAELGVNDFRISDMGVDGDIDFDAREAAVAYNGTNNEYLVVWEGDDTTGTLADGETEIFGQRINASTGAEIGPNDFRISDMGPDGDPVFDAAQPAVAYNSVNNEYLVVWSGEEGLLAGEFEIYGQRLSGNAGTEIGTNDFRISDMGPDGSDIYDAESPAIAYNATANEYLVVWQGDDNTFPLVDGESEIFGQRLGGSTGAQVGTNDFRISDMGPDGDDLFDALSPDASYNITNNQYLVVWSGEDDIGGLVNGEFEIFGQRLDGGTGAQIGTNDFRISDMGPDGDDQYDALSPAVAYNGGENEYMVVWEGDDDTAPLDDGEVEIFGQRIAGATGIEAGTNDVRLSDVGPDGDPLYDAGRPDVAYDPINHRYLVVWEADDDAGETVDGELEIYGQLVDGSTGAESGDNDFRISLMGIDGDPLNDGLRAAVAANSTAGEFMAAWDGDAGTGIMANDEFEIYGIILELSGSGTNSPPVVADIPNQTIAEGETFAAISLDDYVSDIDHADFQITWTATGNVELTVDIIARVATITTPNPSWTGSETITFIATDPALDSDSDQAIFTVGASCCDQPGDANNDGQANVGDAVHLISYIFRGGPPPLCSGEGDANCDGSVNVGDAVYLISYIFRAGPAPCCP